jgi:polygalacturonase
VLIENCEFDTGDDCIAIKSGRNADGRRVNVPVENIVIRGCQMKDGHGGVTIGSEISGGARNIFAENCRMDSPNLDRVLRLKTNSVRGGVIENIYMRNVTVGQVADAIVHVDFHYEEGDTGKFTPTVRNIEVERVTSKKSKYGLYLRGYAKSPIRNVRLKDCTFENVAKADVLEHVEGLSR